MLTDKQIGEIDYFAAQEKTWNANAYEGHQLTPDIVRSLTPNGSGEYHGDGVHSKHVYPS